MNHYLSASTLELLKGRLAALRDNALNEVRAVDIRGLDKPGDQDMTLQDRAEIAEARREQEIDGMQIDIDYAMAGAADAALRRIADGSYGTCRECALPIPQSRLLAIPIALRCAACQRAYEQRHA